MTSKAIILSAGQGSRLLPLTAKRPKCLIEVAGKTILDHQLDALFAAGIESAIVVTGYRSEMIDSHIASRGGNVSTLFNPQWNTSSSIGSVWAARDELYGNFMIVNGDTVYSPSLLREALAGLKPGVSLLVEPVTKPELDEMRVQVDGDRIMAVAKTLDPQLARYRSLGVVAGRDDKGSYRNMLDAVMAQDGGSQSFHHSIVDRLAQIESVHPVMVTDRHWVEIDRPEDIAGWKG